LPTLATPLWPAAKPTTESSVVWIWSSSCPPRGVYAFGQGRLPSASVSVPQGKTALWAEDGVVAERRRLWKLHRGRGFGPRKFPQIPHYANYPEGGLIVAAV